MTLAQVRLDATRRVSARHGHWPAYCEDGWGMLAEIDREVVLTLARMAGVTP